MNIPRPEHPNPQFERKDWLNLNGIWEFEIDPGDSGRDRQLYKKQHFKDQILVPFCPESKLSGIGNVDFMNAVWYRRSFVLPSLWQDGRVLLHFGAVDYLSYIYINEELVGTHRGGYASFQLDITQWICPGENRICVCAQDDVRCPIQPRGKQSETYEGVRCDYTRTTGIWQTVWLEHVPEHRIESVRFYPEPASGCIHIRAAVQGEGTFSARISYRGKPMGNACVHTCGGEIRLSVKLDEIHLWECGNGRLYDAELCFEEDRVSSYFGMRDVRLKDGKFYLNGAPVFLRMVLDQGFYPEGIYTAPDEESLVRDIHLSLEAGFNGARLHEKVFEPRFLYHCDRLGYLVWGEYGNWGSNHNDPELIARILPEWLEVMERDFSHPAIIGWCPLNETDKNAGTPHDEVVRTIYRVTKAMDPSRPCIDASGFFHAETDIYDIHDYEQDTKIFKAKYDKLPEELYDWQGAQQSWRGEPVFMSEYGGILWNQNRTDGWGYGDAPRTEEEFYRRYDGLTRALLENPNMIGFCYTQLYDVEQEQNGLYTYERKPKVDIRRIREVNQSAAAVEQAAPLQRELLA